MQIPLKKKKKSFQMNRNYIMVSKDMHHENPTVSTGNIVAEKKEALTL